MKALRSLFGLLAFFLAGCAAAQPPLLRVCLNEVPHPPWRFADAQGRVAGEGLDFLILELFAKRTGWQVEPVLMPWKRCLADMKGGQIDAVLSMSHLPEREEFAVFPRTSAGQPDERLALRHNRYVLYARREAGAPRWNGKLVSGLAPEGLVGVQSGYSIAATLRGMGLQVDEAARTVQANLEKLARGRVQLAALQEHEAERVLELHPALAQALQRLDPVLEQRAYYPVFSLAFAARSPLPLPRLWEAMAAVRDSSALRRAEAEALKRMESEAEGPRR